MHNPRSYDKYTSTVSYTDGKYYSGSKSDELSIQSSQSSSKFVVETSESDSELEVVDDNISMDSAVLVVALESVVLVALEVELVRFAFLYGLLGFCLGLRTLFFHHRSMASSGQKSFNGMCALVIVNRSSSALFESRDLFLVLITFIWETPSRLHH